MSGHVGTALWAKFRVRVAESSAISAQRRVVIQGGGVSFRRRTAASLLPNAAGEWMQFSGAISAAPFALIGVLTPEKGAQPMIFLWISASASIEGAGVLGVQSMGVPA